MSAAGSVRLEAPAKINLDLRILGRRPDGYHELATVFQAVALHDVVTVTPSRGALRLAGDSSKMPLDASNLAWRAADALWRAAGRSGSPHGARIRIVKRIPAQAGLGGGSSDAAAALVGLNRVWRLGLPRVDLVAIASGLGADVAFFLVGGTALGLGRGDRLVPLPDLPPLPVVLAWPDRGVSTAAAYSWVTPPKSGTVPTSHGNRGLSPNVAGEEGIPNILGMLAGRFAELRNDLEGPVESHRPDVARLRQALAASGALVARMSGSGSACFGLFGSEAPAARAARRLRAGGWHAVATRTIGRPRDARRLAGRVGLV
jgi:4-diphosphocytidyl-2-C-methyl-D-erythritol kinase